MQSYYKISEIKSCSIYYAKVTKRNLYNAQGYYEVFV